MSEQDTTSRRRKGIVVLLSLLLLLATVTFFTTGSVMAASLTISDDTLTTDNGAVTGVTVNASGDITWDGAEAQPDSTTVKLQVQNPDGSWTTVASQTDTLSGLAGTYSYSFTNADIISNTDWNKADFKPSGDGATKDTDLTFRITVETTGDLDGSGSGNTIQSNSDTATLSVTNEANSNGASGSGGVNGSGNDEDPSDNQQ